MKVFCRLAALLLAAIAWTPAGIEAQLRPLEQLTWEVFDRRSVAFAMGAGVHGDQRASLAGTEGRLIEVGNFSAAWRSGRIAVEAAGTVLRTFSDEDRFAPATGGALDEYGPDRNDSGDYRLSTTVLLTPASMTSIQGAVRFGVRLPTTNNRIGLDRDQTDFFGLLAGRARAARLVLSGETGVGIYGTRYPNFEQSDLWIYAASARLPLGSVMPVASILGQMDWSAGDQLRGNEDLAELRAGARIGRGSWLQAEVVKGLTSFSPEVGLLVSLGMNR